MKEKGWIKQALVALLCTMLGLGIALLLVVPVSAYYVVQEEQPPTLDEFLILLSGPWVGLAAGAVLSFGVENVPLFKEWYEAKSSRWKRMIFLGLCLLLPVGSAVLRGGLGFVEWSFDPLIWHAIWAGFAAFVAGSVAHLRKL